MNLKRIRIWNFRCIGTSDNSLSIQDDNPGIDVKLNPHVNVLIGANDSGKTAIVDAVKIILGTQTYDPIRLTDEDFYKSGQNRRSELKIECLFSDFSSIEAGQFLDWIAINDKNEYELRVWLSALRKNNRVICNLKAGHDDEGTFMAGEARDLLRVTYLKPLRDAESELSPGYRSRLAQILSSHPIFIKEKNNNGEEIRHPLELYFKFANDKVKLYFERDFLEENQEIGTKNDMKGGADIKRTIEKQTESFLEQGDSRKPKIEITNMELNAILRKLELILEENKSGLGTLNQLYMATELIFLKGQGHNGLRLALIEELEAHLHPQAQLRVLRSLLDNKKGTSQNEQIQYIITTHSTTLGAAIPLEYLKLCHQGKVYSLDKETTALDEGSYKFLERFLDATKANLFFAKGVMIVEGYAENIIIPAIAEIIGKPLYKYGVSIVNVGSKALLHYVDIFKRKDGSSLPIKVAVVTDLDVEVDDEGNPQGQEGENRRKREKIENRYNDQMGMIKTYCSPLWTLEFDIACGSLWKYMHNAVQIAKKIRANKDWISDNDAEILLKSMESGDDLSIEQDPHKRARKIYEPLLNKQASKTVAAQWLVKLLKDEDRETVKSLIETDKAGDKGIKYLIDAIEHVTNGNIGNN